MNDHVRVRKPADPDLPPRWWVDCPELKLPPSEHSIMGIDSSLTATGLAVIKQGRLHSEVLSPPKGVLGAERLAWFYNQLRARLVQYDPGTVVLEGYGFGAKNQAHSLGELGGVIKLLLDQMQHGPLIVPPTVLKLFATGKGNAEKDAVSKELFKRYGVDLMNNNAVDAAGLAIMGLAYRDDVFAATLTQPQARAMTKVER